MLGKGVLASFFLSVSLVSAYAQTDSVDVNLDKALEMALSESPTVLVADKQVEVKKHYKKEQIASLLPNLSASGSYSRNLKKQMIAIGGGKPIQMGTDNVYNGGFNLSLPLIAPALWNTVQLSEMDITLALESARSSRISMVNQIKKAFFQYLLAEESYDVLKLSYANMQENLQNVVDRFEQGEVSEYDKISAEVQLQNLKPQVVQAKNAVSLADLQLKILIGMDVTEPVRFVGDINDYEALMDYAEIASMTDELYNNDELLSGNSDLKQMQIQSMQLDKSGDILRAQFYPTLALSASYGWMTMNSDFKIGSYTWYPNSSLGLSLSVPIFQGNKIRQQIKQNKIQKESMDIQLENLVRQTKISIQTALDNMTSALEEISYSKDNIKQAQKAYDLSAERYKVGSGTLLELNNSDLALIQARLSYSQAIFNYLSAAADLEKALGKDYVVADGQ